MPKISISIPEEMIDFIDEQGKNRSKTIVTILEDFRRKKREEELEKAYKEFDDFCREDDKDFWQDWERSACEDFLKGEEDGQ